MKPEVVWVRRYLMVKQANGRASRLVDGLRRWMNRQKHTIAISDNTLTKYLRGR